jgi:BlaI family penicillinase repressor
MKKQPSLNQSEWQVMELLWQKPHTLMEMVSALSQSVGWSKSTVATMVRRMEEKGLISYQEQGKARVFSPNVSLEHVAARETDSLLNRAYKGSLSMLVSNLVQRNGLSQDDIDELYAILKQAEEDAK